MEMRFTGYDVGDVECGIVAISDDEYKARDLVAKLDAERESLSENLYPVIPKAIYKNQAERLNKVIALFGETNTWSDDFRNVIEARLGINIDKVNAQSARLARYKELQDSEFVVRACDNVIGL